MLAAPTELDFITGSDERINEGSIQPIVTWFYGNSGRTS
jgi:hypothetical protein